jgi:hypothetical protein
MSQSHVGSGRWQVGGQPRGEEALSLSPRLSPANTMACARAFLYYYMSALASHSESVEHVHCAASGRVLQSVSLLGRTGRGVACLPAVYVHMLPSPCVRVVRPLTIWTGAVAVLCLLFSTFGAARRGNHGTMGG